MFGVNRTQWTANTKQSETHLTVKTATLMVQGTTSDAGKSTLVTALCRWLARQNVKVAPFKPQNMALNSAVTVDGGEIGRAQAVQAQACGLLPHTDFNPVLLKPNSDIGAQVIIHGHAISNMDAREFHNYKQVAQKAVLESYHRLCTQYEAIIVEGAGSPAEINLRDRDIANMGFAEAVDCPVILIADIDRGGVFAHIVGTLALLSESERNRIVGFVINRFRGDLSLLQPGLDWLEKETGKPVIGVLPYLQGLYLEAEDALPRQKAGTDNTKWRVISPALPRISNHTDLDPLRLNPDLDCRFIGPDEAIPAADLIVLPGSKSVRQDLAWLRQQGWDRAIARHLRYGGKMIGICGGFQMLGQTVIDDHGLEGEAGASLGLGWLDVSTTLEPTKQLRTVRGVLSIGNAAVAGYEIHAGVTTGNGLARPVAALENNSPDGAISADNQVLGTYLHGIFDQPEACAALLAWAGMNNASGIDYRAKQEHGINALADAVQNHLDKATLHRLLGMNGPNRQ